MLTDIDIETNFFETLFSNDTVKFASIIIYIFLILSVHVVKVAEISKAGSGTTTKDFTVPRVDSICIHDKLIECIPCDHENTRVVVENFSNADSGNDVNIIHLYPPEF